MAESPVKDIKGSVSVLVLIDGAEIPKTNFVQSVEVVKEINRIPYAKIALHDGDVGKQSYPISEKMEPGKEIEIKAGQGPGQEKTIFKGIIAELGIKLNQKGESSLVLKCKDKALKLTVGRKNKMFFDKKDSDIISSIVSEAGLSADVEATSATHKKIVRNWCTDWDFILARADINGLVTIVDAGKVVSKKPKYENCGLKISYGNDLVEMNVSIDSTYQLSEVKSFSWSHKDQKIETMSGSKPSVNSQSDLDLGKLSKVIEPKEHLQTVANVTKDMLKPWADAVWQRMALSRVRGTVRFYGSDKAVVGKTVELFGIGKHFTGEGYITRVRHTIVQSQWLTDVELGIPSRTHLEDNLNAQPLPAGGLLPGIHGLQVAIVKKIHDDPDGEGRVLVNIPMIDNMEGPGIWIRMAHPYATKSAGFVFYPEVGDEVVIGFLDNDPAHGILLGSLYCSKASQNLAKDHTPDSKNTHKAISTTEGKLRIEIEDVKKIITLITPKKHKLVMDDDKESITLEDPVNKNKMVFDSKGITITADKDITIKTKANFKLEAMSNIETKSTASTTMKATASMTIEGTAGATFKSPATTTIKGGVVLIN